LEASYLTEDETAALLDEAQRARPYLRRAHDGGDLLENTFASVFRTLCGPCAKETFTRASDVDIALFGEDLTLSDQAARRGCQTLRA